MMRFSGVVPKEKYCWATYAARTTAVTQPTAMLEERDQVGPEKLRVVAKRQSVATCKRVPSQSMEATGLFAG